MILSDKVSVRVSTSPDRSASGISVLMPAKVNVETTCADNPGTKQKQLNTSHAGMGARAIRDITPFISNSHSRSSGPVKPGLAGCDVTKFKDSIRSRRSRAECLPSGGWQTCRVLDQVRIAWNARKTNHNVLSLQRRRNEIHARGENRIAS